MWPENPGPQRRLVARKIIELNQGGFSSQPCLIAGKGNPRASGPEYLDGTIDETMVPSAPFCDHFALGKMMMSKCIWDWVVSAVWTGIVLGA